MKEYICKDVPSDYGGYLDIEKELIRCKDCVWFDEKVPCCRLHSRAVFKKEKQFCSWAEPKETEE